MTEGDRRIERRNGGIVAPDMASILDPRLSEIPELGSARSLRRRELRHRPLQALFSPTESAGSVYGRAVDLVMVSAMENPRFIDETRRHSSGRLRSEGPATNSWRNGARRAP
jgi:hypothetical protein